MSNAKKLVFDIETIGQDFKELDKITQEYLLHYAESEEEEEETKERLGFYPLTGEIVVIGVLNPDTGQGGVFAQPGKAKNPPEIIEEGVTAFWGNEKEILEKFWEAVRLYDYFISFNGRSFDVPFLMIRSAIQKVKPTKNLLSNRYLGSQVSGAKHVDLLDQLTFYGAFRRKFNLHMWTKAFGIESPKEGGVTGDDVTRLFTKGEAETIVRYNLRDLRSTASLYEKWETYINI